MKNLTPNSISFLLSLFISLCIALVLFLYQLSEREVNALFLLSCWFLSFLVTFFSVRYALKNFIYDKIKVIYRTIHKLQSGEEISLKNLDLSRDIFKDINIEVVQWAEINRNEIEQLKKLESYRREFVGNVLHEIKTPIFSIQGYLLTLLDGGLKDDSINEDYLKRAVKNVDRMINIVEDLDAISQLESGELHLYWEKFDVIVLVKEIMQGLELSASAKKIKLKLKENYEKPIKVYADKERIRQVFTNLIVNSIKYGKDEGATEMGFYDMDEHFLVEVADNGIGIAKEHLPRLFERFYRVDRGRSRDTGGTGLGLSIVKHIVEAHKQNIQVRSTEGVGTVFSFTLKKA